MASGWGCQFLTKIDEKIDWCKRLKKTCSPGTKGCILDGHSVFATPEFLTLNEEPKKIKKRSDNPLAER